MLVDFERNDLIERQVVPLEAVDEPEGADGCGIAVPPAIEGSTQLFGRGLIIKPRDESCIPA